MTDTPHLFDPDTHNEPLDGLWDEPVRFGPSTIVPDDDWAPSYSPWRHGGWYVDNVRYPGGAVGCVSRNYADRKWRIVCDDRPGSWPDGPDDHVYSSRDAAARAERAIALAACEAAPKCEHCGKPYDARFGCQRAACKGATS